MTRKRSKRGGQSAAKDESVKAAKITKPESVKASDVKKPAEKSTSKVETKSDTKAEKVEKKTETKAPIIMGAAAEKGNVFKAFFAKKYEGKENVDSLFGSPKLVAALVAEILASFTVVMVCLLTATVGPLYIMFGVLAASLMAYKISGAMINPIVTIGALATRRISVIRAIFYIIAQVLGAMLAYIVLKSFVGMAEVDDPSLGAPTLYTMTAIPEGKLWAAATMEAIGSAIIALFFARAIQMKKSPFTFGAIFAGGVCTAIVFALSTASFIASGWALNPALAVAMEAFTKVPENFGVNALAYIVAPMVGGILGFFISDLVTRGAGTQEA